jgi:putative endonuclease
MSNERKKKGKEAELLVADYLVNLGYNIIEQNYTIRGGEIDIIAEKKNIRTFVEVKAVDHTEDLLDYLTPRKQATLIRTLIRFNYEHPTDKQISLDLVFVKQNTIIHHYPNITNN